MWMKLSNLLKKGYLRGARRTAIPLFGTLSIYTVVYLQARADGGSSVIDLEDARKRKLGAEARLAEIELLKAEEQIISVDSHSEIIGKIGELVRGRMTAIPSKTAPG